MDKEEIYISERDMYQSILNLIGDKERLDKLIDSSSWKNRDDFKSGMIFGLSIAAMEASVNSHKVIVKFESNKYIDILNKSLNEGNIKVSDSIDDYICGDCDSLIYDECLCIRGSVLDELMKPHINGYLRSTMIKSLISIDALKFSGKKYTIKVGNSNLRSYAIKLSALSLKG